MSPQVESALGGVVFVALCVGLFFAVLWLVGWIVSRLGD
jgi:hypothetical protein